jgi:hypothetical protein
MQSCNNRDTKKRYTKMNGCALEREYRKKCGQNKKMCGVGTLFYPLI